MNDWKRSFVKNLRDAQSHWGQRFEQALDGVVAPAFDELGEFLSNHQFSVSKPMNDEGCKSFKFALAEDAYLLMIFRSTCLGNFELRCESFVPGSTSAQNMSDCRVADVNERWATEQFQSALDAFVEQLAGSASEKFEELVAV